MENYDYANAAKPSCGLIHGVETNPSQRLEAMNYIRTGTSAKPLTITDLGVLYVGTEGIQFSAAGTAVVGELWVTYRVRFSRAKLYQALLGNSIQQALFSGLTSANPMLSSIVRSLSSTLSCSLLVPTATTVNLVFPANIISGTYEVILAISQGGTLTTQYISNVISPSNCQLYRAGLAPANTLSLAFASGPNSPVGTTANGGIMCQFMIVVNAPGAAVASCVIQLSAAIGVGSYTMSIKQAPQGWAQSLTA